MFNFERAIDFVVPKTLILPFFKMKIKKMENDIKNQSNGKIEVSTRGGAKIDKFFEGSVQF